MVSPRVCRTYFCVILQRVASRLSTLGAVVSKMREVSMNETTGQSHLTRRWQSIRISKVDSIGLPRSFWASSTTWLSTCGASAASWRKCTLDFPSSRARMNRNNWPVSWRSLGIQTDSSLRRGKGKEYSLVSKLPNHVVQPHNR